MGRRSKEIILNEEQKKMVEDNYNLIYSYANLHNLPLDIENYNACKPQAPFGNEDWFGALATGLCKAAFLYDETKSTFATFAYKCMDTEVFLVKRSYKVHNPPDLRNLDEILATMKSNKNYADKCGFDKIQYDSGYYNRPADSQIDFQLFLDQEYKKLGKYGEACRRILEDKDQYNEVAQEMGVTRQCIWHYYNNIFLPRIRQKLLAVQAREGRENNNA